MLNSRTVCFYAGVDSAVEAYRAINMTRGKLRNKQYQKLILVVSDLGVLLLEATSLGSAQRKLKFVRTLDKITNTAIYKTDER